MDRISVASPSRCLPSAHSRVIPGFALLPQGGFCGTTVYYRYLDG
jgi:hypothetical protein